MAKVYGLVIIDMAQEQVYQGPGSSCIIPKPMFQNILNISNKLPKERVMDSRLWMTPEDNSSLSKICDVGIANSPGAMLVRELEGLNATYVKKVQYSAFFESELDILLKAQGITDIILTGINTDYCVLASALDAFYLRYKVHLVKDACWSFGGAEGHKEGIYEIDKFLLTYCKCVTTEEVLKELD